MKRVLVPSLLTLALCSPLSAQPSMEVDARLTYSMGDVTLTSRDGKAKGPTVQGDMPLAEGDYLRVGPEGHAEICIDAKTIIRLEPDSYFRIKRLAPKNIILALYSGTLLANVKFDKDEGAQLSVVTPTAVAAVRGTEFVVQQEAWGSRVGVLDEGHVAVKGKGSKREVILHFNQETRVRRGHAVEKAHHLDHLYSYKIPMSGMRDRIKLLRSQWGTLTLEQRQMVRQAWINTHTQKAAPDYHKHTQQKRKPKPRPHH